MGEHFRQRSRHHYFAAVNAGARSQIDDVVGAANRFLVMFDDEHGVSQIAQSFERFQQLLVVPLVQSDAGLVQNVEHADESGADLRGQPDALRLAAAQRAALAIQRQITQAHVPQKHQPGTNFFDDLPGNLLLEIREFQFGEKIGGLINGKRADIHDG